MDMLLLAVLGRLFAAGAAGNTSFKMLGGMLVSLLAADTAFAVTILSGTYYNDSASVRAGSPSWRRPR